MIEQNFLNTYFNMGSLMFFFNEINKISTSRGFNGRILLKKLLSLKHGNLNPAKKCTILKHLQIIADNKF